ncbi:MFS transporter [Paraburkholderia sp.]|uniref:MFS transporter n=1 Tax=Paraburkholderia sp. TaxID=1926495 RepID=UPI002383486F|nr:MFS transporter [Paraburkholderia sp.]MDE1184791.1 MFS transporter [Paraburkholderia sp.]
MPIQSSRQLRIVQVAACLGFVIVLLDVSVVNVALESLRSAFGANVTGLQWVINAYALIFAALLLTAGALGDRVGAKRVYMSGLALFTAASAGCGLATALDGLIAFRIAQGLGAALLVPSSLSLIRQVFHDADMRSRAIGWWAAGGGIALAAGPVIGGVLIGALGWRSIFLINLPIGVLGLVLVARYAPASTTPVLTATQAQQNRGLDLRGQCAGASSLASLTVALTEASRLGWTHPLIVGAFAGFVVTGALFVWIEARSPSAMLPLTLFSDTTVSSATVIGLIANLAFYGIVFAFSLYFQSVRHLDPTRTGIAFLPMMAILVVMNIAAGRIVTRFGARTLTVAGLLVSACGYLLLLSVSATQPYALLAIPMLLAGGGIALTIPTITNATLAAVPHTQAGIASGLLNAARQVGGVIGVALFGFFIRDPDPARFIDGLHVALITSAVLLGIAALIGYLGVKTRTGDDTPALACIAATTVRTSRASR